MLRRSDLMPASQPFFRWFRKTGMAIAARMPMMMMTTRSSMRVKPPSRSSAILRIRASIALPPDEGRAAEPSEDDDNVDIGNDGRALDGLLVVRSDHFREDTVRTGSGAEFLVVDDLDVSR